MGRILCVGTTGQDVRALQDALNFHIRRGEKLTVDGIFGPKTNARVREFQKANGLTVDGLVGPKTEAELYEVITLPLGIVFMQNLTLPILGQPQGINPPRLIPPLQWPGPPFFPPPPFSAGGTFRLGQSALTQLPPFNSVNNALSMSLTMPTRKDPDDPTVASYKTIIGFIDDLPVNSKFKAFLTSKIPNPVKKILPPPTGFRWGAEPLFDPLDPKGFGVKGNAAFSVKVAEGSDGKPTVTVGAWGDGKVFLNFTGQQGQSRPRVEAEGQVFVGVMGNF
jgi:hypothetical protein